MSMSFNAEISVSKKFEKLMMESSLELAKRAVLECGKRYGFDGLEAIRNLDLENVKIGKGKKKGKKEVFPVPLPLPFNGEKKEGLCNGLSHNHGLYTQCPNAVEEQFCESCQVSACEYGTIDQRCAVGINEFVDPQGRRPTPYIKVLKKLKQTEEAAKLEAEKQGITINEIHFEAKRGRPALKEKVVKPISTGKKGRPKKEKKTIEIEDDEVDLFAELVTSVKSDTESEASESVASESDSESDSESVTEPSTESEEIPTEAEDESTKKPTTADVEKFKELIAEAVAAKKAEEAAKEEEKKAKKAEEKAAKKAEEKAAKEEQRIKEKEEKEAKKAEEEAKKAEEKAAKEEQRIKEKEEKEAKKAQEKEAKEQQLKEKEAKKAEKEAKKEKEPKKEPKNEAKEKEDQPAEVVKKFDYEGKKYLRSKSTGIVYDYTKYVESREQVVLGQWNETTSKIEFSCDEESEEEEEDYEEED